MSDPREPFDAERTNVMVRRFVLMLVLGSLFCAGIPFAENLHLGRDPAALVDLGLALLGLGACAIIGFSAFMLAAKGAARQVRRLHVVVFSLILLTFLVQLLIPAVEPYGLVMLPLTVGGMGLGLWLFFADDRSWLGRWARPRIAELFDQLESVDEVPPVSPIRVPQLPQPTTLAEAEDQLRLMREELERAQKVLREHSESVAELSRTRQALTKELTGLLGEVVRGENARNRRGDLPMHVSFLLAGVVLGVIGNALTPRLVELWNELSH